MSNEQENMAPNGMKIELTFLEGLGVSPYSILEAAWVLPAVIAGIRTRIWAKIYDKKILNKYLASFRKDEKELENFLLYITDYKHFKKNFFK